MLQGICTHSNPHGNHLALPACSTLQGDAEPQASLSVLGIEGRGILRLVNDPNIDPIEAVRTGVCRPANQINFLQSIEAFIGDLSTVLCRG